MRFSLLISLFVGFSTIAVAEDLEQRCFQLIFVDPRGYQRCIDTAHRAQEILRRTAEAMQVSPEQSQALPTTGSLCPYVPADQQEECRSRERDVESRIDRLIESVYRETASRVAHATNDPSIASEPNNANTMLFWWMLANQSPAASNAIGDGSGTSYPFLAFLYGPSVLQWSQPSAADNAQTANFANFIRVNGF